MSIEIPKHLQLLDCTIRDGGYINAWKFEKKIVREVYRACSNAGVDFVEIGFRGNEKYFDKQDYGIWRFSSDENIREAIDGIAGTKISVMGDYGKIDCDDIVEKKNSPVDLVRIAAHRDKIIDASNFINNVKTKGYLTSLQAMGFSSYNSNERRELIKAVKNSGIDYLYIADSYGSFFPHQITGIFEPFLEIENLKVGFHPHNNLQMAFANTVEAIRCGVNIIDGSVYGMGRGAGNLPIESVVAYFESILKDQYNVVPLLNIIDEYFTELYREYQWGYKLPYMISGIYKCHPYFADDLISRREYTIEDIWRILGHINRLNPVGFDRGIVDDIIKKEGIIDEFNESTIAIEKGSIWDNREEGVCAVTYKKRHEGRDFLVLANGPSLREYRDKIKLFVEEHNPVILGANNLEMMFAPHYHAFSNKVRFMMHIDNVSPHSRLLIGENISRDIIVEYTHRDYETLCFRDVLDADFNIYDGRIQSNCRSVSVLLTGVAIVMGARRIFIVGMDGYLGKTKTNALFYEEKFQTSEHGLQLHIHRWNEHFLKQIDLYLKKGGNEGVQIITPTSYKTMYKDIKGYL